MTYRSGSSSPPGMFAFDDNFGLSVHNDRHAPYNAPSGPGTRRSQGRNMDSDTPWSSRPCSSSCPAAMQILNSYYSQLSLPAHQTEQDSFKQRYQRDMALVERAVKLRDGMLQPHPEGGFSPPPRPDQTGSDNTTVFVGGLQPGIHSDLIRAIFTPFGDIDYVKTPPGKGCGFVRYFCKADAEKAIEKMQGFEIEHHRLRLSWGRSTSGEKSWGSVDTRSLQRLVRYIEPQIASRILTAIDEVFEGNMQSFREGLQYLVIANAATSAISSQESPSAREAGSDPSAAPFASPSQPPRSQASGYIGPLDRSASWNELHRSSSGSSVEHRLSEDETSLTSFSPTLSSESLFGWQSQGPVTSQPTVEPPKQGKETKKPTAAKVDLRNVSQLPIPEFVPQCPRSASLSSRNAFGAIGSSPEGHISSSKPSYGPSGYGFGPSYKTFAPSAPSLAPLQTKTGRRVSDSKDDHGSQWSYPSFAPPSWRADWYNPTSGGPVSVGSGAI